MITKMLRKDQQGIGSGLRDAAGTLSRIVGPLWSTYLFLHYGSFYVFMICGGLIFASGFLQLFTLKWMVPVKQG